MRYESAQLRKHGSKWRGQLKYREYTGEWSTEDGEVFDSEEDALKHKREEELEKQPKRLFVWKSKSKVLDATGKRDAQNKLKEWRDKMEREAEDEVVREQNPAHGVTVAEYVAAYIAERAQGVTPTTVSGYKQLLNNVIAPAFEGVALADLDPAKVGAWLTDERERGKYTAVTIRKAFMLLKSATKQAVERDELPKDPTRTVKAPRPDEGKPNALDERGRGRVAAFLDIEPTDPASIAIRLALFCGMRRGEICGLRWRNVDTKGGVLSVVESVGMADKADLKGNASNLEFSGLYVKAPKNRKSARVVSFPASVGRALEARRAAMKADCMAAGVSFRDDMFVCGDVEGNPLHPHQLYRRWTATAEALGLVGTQGRAVTFHDLRHTYATTAIAHGIDVKTVSESMGHTNAAMTLNRYASADPDAARRATETLERAFEAERKAAEGAGEVIEMGKTGTED